MSSQPVELNQFWVEIATAHDYVEGNRDQEVTVARNGYEAKVYYDQVLDGVMVIIKPAETATVEPLQSP